MCCFRLFFARVREAGRLHVSGLEILYHDSEVSVASKEGSIHAAVWGGKSVVLCIYLCTCAITFAVNFCVVSFSLVDSITAQGDRGCMLKKRVASVEERCLVSRCLALRPLHTNGQLWAEERRREETKSPPSRTNDHIDEHPFSEIEKRKIRKRSEKRREKEEECGLLAYRRPYIGFGWIEGMRPWKLGQDVVIVINSTGWVWCCGEGRHFESGRAKCVSRVE